ncbi:MAG TPA: hypothetical protein VJS11_10830 [Acidobacteriaceae bacterium]|nr:hypothetical protein [Acidobacteriaceae bacterium]
MTRRVAYPLWLRRHHPHYSRYARQFQKSQHFTPEELERWQSLRLREQLLHAFRNIPFYRRRFEMNGITPLDIRTPEDLKTLPVLTKAELRCHNEELLARTVPPDSRVQDETVGSSGMPVRFWIDKERLDSRRASLDRHNAWAGLYPGTWHAHLSGLRPAAGSGAQKIGWRERLIDRCLLLNTSLIGDRDLRQYIALLRRYRPRVMVAYAQSAVFFARYCEQNGIRDIHFRTVVVTAEMLLPGQRTLLEEVFHAQVFNRYSSREFSVIASDCPEMTGMHINADTLIVEVERSANTGVRAGRVLITDLLNRAMPLIRYEIGDLASPLETAVCPCGRAFPRIANVRGRVTDFLVTTDDRRISGVPLAAIARDMPQVRQIQFVQRDRGHVQLRVVPGQNYGADTIEELRRRLNPLFSGNTELSIVTVEQIQPERLGKFRVARTSPQLSDTIAQQWSA